MRLKRPTPSPRTSCFVAGKGTADFAFVDFNFTHGLSFVGASGTTACANVSELQYGETQGRADELRGYVDAVTREDRGLLLRTEVTTSEIEDHSQINSTRVKEGLRGGWGTSRLGILQGKRWRSERACADELPCERSTPLATITQASRVSRSCAPPTMAEAPAPMYPSTSPRSRLMARGRLGVRRVAH